MLNLINISSFKKGATMTKRSDIKIKNKHGIKIVMNEDKILKENKYDLEKIYNAIDEIAKFSKMKKIDKYYYVSKNDTPSELGCFVWTNLEKKEWFIKNVKEWIWYEKNGQQVDIFKILEEDIYE